MLDRLPTGSRRHSGGPSVFASIPRPGIEPPGFFGDGAGLRSQRRPVGPAARVVQVDPMGVEPTAPTLQGSVAASGMRAHLSLSRGPSGGRTRPSALPKRCAPGTPTDLIHRLIPDGVEPSSPACRAGVVPLDHGISLMRGDDWVAQRNSLARC